MIKISATLVSLIIPVVLMSLKLSDASGNVIPCWKLIWPLFGITNQLLAALVLLIIYLWAEKEGIKNRILMLVPALFMLVTTVTALVQSIAGFLAARNFTIIFYIAVVLLALSCVVIFESIAALRRKKPAEAAAPA